MKRLVLVISCIIIAAAHGITAQNNCTTTGAGNNSVEKVALTNRTDLALVIEKTTDVELLKSVSGKSRGFKFVPLLPFLPKQAPGIVNINAEETKAEKNALYNSGGDIILNKKVERTYTGILLVFWIEKIEVSGIAAKIIR